MSRQCDCRACARVRARLYLDMFVAKRALHVSALQWMAYWRSQGEAYAGQRRYQFLRALDRARTLRSEGLEVLP